jgi:hypothetical protein
MAIYSIKIKIILTACFNYYVLLHVYIGGLDAQIYNLLTNISFITL